MAALSEVGGQSLPREYGVSLPFQLSREVQDQLMSEVETRGRAVADLHEERAPYWRAYSAREIDVENSPQEVPYGRLKELDVMDEFGYFVRLCPEFTWSWKRDPLALLLRSQMEETVLGSSCGLFHHLSRVYVFLQIPGQEVPTHRDLNPGSRYPQMHCEFSMDSGEQTLLYRGSRWFDQHLSHYQNDRHRRQGHFGLRLPFSEYRGENGQAFFVVQGRKCYYSSKERFFLLNESVFHGAEAVSFRRGVIFIDGILNLKALEEASWRPLQCLSLSPSSEKEP